MHRGYLCVMGILFLADMVLLILFNQRTREVRPLIGCYEHVRQGRLKADVPSYINQSQQ